MGSQAASTGSSVLNTGIGMYSAHQAGRSNIYNTKREAALTKTRLLNEYREIMATNLAHNTVSGTTNSGNVTAVANENTYSLNEDVSNVDSQANSQIRLAKIGSRGQMASILSSSLGKELSNYTSKKDAWKKIGNEDGEKFSYFK